MNPEYVTHIMVLIILVQLISFIIQNNTSIISFEQVNTINLVCVGLVWGIFIGKWMVLL